MIANKLVHAVELVKKRRARLKKRRSTASQRAAQVGAMALGVLSVIAALLALIALPAYFYLMAEAPPVERVEELLDPVAGEMLQPTRLYDQTGETLLLSLIPEGITRKFLSASDVPWLVKAIVASNQPDYLSTGSLDLIGILNPPNSITEHLVAKVLLPTQPESWRKNIQTKLLAAEMQEKFGADQVLAWALNSMDFGNWALGAEAAAQLYFGKPATELSLAESALLAAVAQAPALNPHDTPELAIRFQRVVLAAMFEQGLITQVELNSAANELLVFAPQREPTSLAPDFTALAVEQLEAEVGHERLINGGLDVTTTIDYTLQQDVDRLAGSGENVVVVLDPVNNRLLAASGNVATQTDSAPLLDPFVYLSEFAKGLSPASMTWDIGGPIDDPLASFHGPVTLRQSLASRFSNVTLSLSGDPTVQNYLLRLWQAMGFENESPSGQMSSLDAAGIFSVLAQNGLSVQDSSTAPNTILFAASLDGLVEYDRTHTQWQSVVSAELSYLVTDILSDATFWISSMQLSRPAALLSDPSQQWQIMYSPQRVIVIRNSAERNLGLTPAVFEAAHHGLPIKGWEIPAGLASVIVCVPSGQLPDDDCPQTRREWFLRGNEPTTTDALYQRIAINTLNGKLATVFTPAEFVQERVFLIMPPEAESWAQAAGVPLPPTDYDPIPEFIVDQQTLAITEPDPFDEIGGLVTITGRLGADIEGYDIQIGQGLRPDEWNLLTGNYTAPRTVALAEWDTTGLSGIWAIQLQAWNAGGKVTRAYTIVTIK